MLVIVVLAIVLQHRVTKVVVEVAIHTVKVIGIVLGVVVLDQEIRRLDPIIMPLPRLERTGPGEVDFLEVEPLEMLHALVRRVLEPLK